MINGELCQLLPNPSPSIGGLNIDVPNIAIPTIVGHKDNGIQALKALTSDRANHFAIGGFGNECGIV